jgi:hypothetical protein
MHSASSKKRKSEMEMEKGFGRSDGCRRISGCCLLLHYTATAHRQQHVPAKLWQVVSETAIVLRVVILFD